MIPVGFGACCRFMIPVGFGACCRFSRDGAVRSDERGTGSLESRGIPDGLEELGECSILSNAGLDRLMLRKGGTLNTEDVHRVVLTRDKVAV
jgi:hypothetical protein